MNVSSKKKTTSTINIQIEGENERDADKERQKGNASRFKHQKKNHSVLAQLQAPEMCTHMWEKTAAAVAPPV